MASERRPVLEAPLPLVGRQEELRNLTAAFGERQPRLILGPPGSGKTALLTEASRLAGAPCAYVSKPAVLHELLVALAKQLRCRLKGFASVERATSLALKGAILESLRERPHIVEIDDVSMADPRMYRFLQQVRFLPGVSLAVSANSRESLGHLGKLMWDPREEIRLRPLGRSDARLLFDAAAEAYGLDSVDLDEFRRHALAAAQGNPGQIVRMCRLATRPEYRDGRHIRFAPLRMDLLIAHR